MPARVALAAAGQRRTAGTSLIDSLASSSAHERAKMTSLLAFLGAALMEIAGCFAFWAWLRLDKSPLWLIPGMVALALFAYLLTLVDSPLAGRAYAAYGGIYIAAALIWGWVAEGQRPDSWDVTGAAICLVGMAVILFGHRGGAA